MSSLKKVSIHFIDDEVDILNLMHLRFQRLEISNQVQLIFSEGYRDLVSKLQENGQDDILVIVTDINMPEYSGFDVISKVKELRHDYRENVFFYIASAYDKSQFSDDPNMKDVLGYFKKPFDVDEMMKSIVSDLAEHGINIDVAKK